MIITAKKKIKDKNYCAFKSLLLEQCLLQKQYMDLSSNHHKISKTKKKKYLEKPSQDFNNDLF